MRIFAKSTVLLLTLLLLVQFCACTNQADTENNDNSVQISDNSASSESTDMSKISELPEKNWDGREFRVLGYENSYTQFSTFEIDTDGETGEVVNDAVYRRNLAIEEKYNVEITEYKDTEPVYGNATAPFIRQFVLAQEDEFDLVFANANCIGALAREGLFADLKEIDYIDFSKDWWNKEVNDSLSIMNKQYFASSNFSLRDKSRAYIMLYNRALADDYDLGNPVDYVHNGTWTFDVMSQWARIAAQDLNGNGTVDDSDTFGIVMDSYQSTQALTSGFGIRVIGKDENDIPKLVLNSEHTVNGIDKIISLISEKGAASFCEEWIGKVDYDGWYFHNRAFNEGRAMFITTFPHELKAYATECEDEYGIIPFPKYDEKQEKYYTMADMYCMLFAVPVTCPDNDFAGFMLEALSYESTDTTLKAYYEISCKNRYTYDEESAEMLDLTFDGIIYEPATIYNISGVSNMIYNIGMKKSNTFASDYASVESAALADIEKLMNDFKD